MSRYRIAGVNFDHFHMGDNLRAVSRHDGAELVGLCDEQPERMEEAIAAFDVPRDRVYTDVERCLEETRPDVVVLCPAAARHGEWTERVARHAVHVLVEKPFAASLAEADRMAAAVAATGKRLMINWPLAWMPSHRTAKRLVDEALGGPVARHPRQRPVDHQPLAGRGDGRRHAVGLGERRRERLLDEDVDRVPRDALGPLAVARGRGAEHDDVGAGLLQAALDVGVDAVARHVERRDRLLHAFGLLVAQPDQLGAVVPGHGAQVVAHVEVVEVDAGDAVAAHCGLRRALWSWSGSSQLCCGCARSRSCCSSAASGSLCSGV